MKRVVIILLMLVLSADCSLLLPQCVTYCSTNDVVVDSTTCRAIAALDGVCSPLAERMMPDNTTKCVGPPLECSGQLLDGGRCCTSSQAPSAGGCPTSCCGDIFSICTVGVFTASVGLCVAGYQSYVCPYTTLSDGSCVQYYPAPNVMSSAQCNQPPSTDGCAWCEGISVCLPNNVSCPSTCPQAPTALCTLPPSRCQWCTSSSSIGVCQNKTGTCWNECLPASDDPLSPSLCSSSASCRWCSALGYCTPFNSTCHTNCTTVAPERPAICQVQSIQAQCQWCGGTGNNNSFQYCVARNDEQRLRCATSCTGLIWREDVCVGAPSCHWCGVHGGRCKPRRSSVYVGWRREVECDTESESSSASVSPRLSDTATLTCSVSRNTATPSVTFSITSSMTATLSGDASSTVSPSCSRTPTITQTLSTTSTVTMTLSESARTFTNELTLTLSAAASSITIESSASFRRATASASASHERTRTSTNLFTHSLSPSRTTTFSRSSTQSTLSLSTSISRPASISCSQSMSTRSISSSYRLPPCTATHASVINAVWPKLFHVVTNETMIRLIGFQRTQVVTDVALPLNNYIPLFLLNSSAVTGRFAYAPPVPYTTPNIDGLVNRNSIDAKIRWINGATIELTVAPIPSYAIDLDEDASIDISFELLELCNRHDAASIPMPDVVSLISVHVASLSGDNTFQAAAQPVSIISYLSGLLSGDPC